MIYSLKYEIVWILSKIYEKKIKYNFINFIPVALFFYMALSAELNFNFKCLFLSI